MLYKHKATPTEGGAGVDLAIDESGTFVRFRAPSKRRRA
jgi:hypothetical protein